VREVIIDAPMCSFQVSVEAAEGFAHPCQSEDGSQVEATGDGISDRVELGTESMHKWKVAIGITEVGAEQFRRF